MKVVRVGVGVLIFNNLGEILLGLRLNSHGENTWAPPGGHLEMGESFEQCAIREVLEETGLNIDGIKIITVTNDIFAPDKHYVTIISKTSIREGRIHVPVLEPLKCLEWKWFALEALPDPLFLPLVNMLKQSPTTLIEAFESA
ncbi:MAG: ADP-ribose pyrophosphatase [Rickettsiaceae bacterium]|jgi:8-oxo-dGTP diphosphatase|nr:ADP-ribose pyrophosphatase [Rickettsiaceae bacterium]